MDKIIKREVALQLMKDEMPSKFDKTPVTVVIFKDIKTGETVKLNLQRKQNDSGNFLNWKKNLKVGNVLEVTTQAKNNKLINQWVPFKLIKKV